jgi:subtilisin family serine protease
MGVPAPVHGTVRPLVAALAAVLALALAGPALGAGTVVVLADGAPAARVAERNGLAPDHLYRRALTGFAADLTADQAAALREDPAVRAVLPDRAVRLTELDRPLVAGAGVRRIGGELSPSARINGRDDRVNADIAVIDSGVHPGHRDLNVVAGVDCANAGTTGDTEGHGTFIAGIAAGIDDGLGVVGTAPGARIWSARVADRRGAIAVSGVLCALDWVLQHGDEIDVVNLSLGSPGADGGNCGRDALGLVQDAMHAAICSVVERGITVVVAAGNDAAPVAGTVPASYDEVITVSALADLDGIPGGLAEPVCAGTRLAVTDDALAPFSNFGEGVDIAAPGVCIESSVPGGYRIADGTSAAAPFVAGAAALVRAGDPAATPADVRARLLELATPGPLPLDPDPFAEPLLSLRGL